MSTDEVSDVPVLAPDGAPPEVVPPQGVQEEMFALVHGQPVMQMPKDLYIPPDALQVFLEAFEGPLDLLLYLIRRQNIDILDIPMFEITKQYIEYVEMMKAMNLELAAEYLVMAAVLAEIKSRMLLPRPPSEEGEEEDPRAELVRRLQEYERFKKAAEDIDELPRTGRDVYLASSDTPNLELHKPLPEVELKEVLLSLRDVLRRAEMFTHHHVQKEVLSVRERMSKVLEHLSQVHFTEFQDLFTIEEGRMGVVVTFLAIMELSRESLVEVIQSELFGPIHVRAKVQ
ncbi:segregation and condensation protein A [Permianibacter aggregans]|uniref:Segregation and condensation protein A n=1 Tax=Permianibacter aggregans TaxID=1510150 RepID=A0A4R6UXF5_9GAMM|nr:segregation/condensation protein A [Permianibacter aggregans]TDQ50603.1 condensin subunit ScpA [Permianibacter aggregans]